MLVLTILDWYKKKTRRILISESIYIEMLGIFLLEEVCFQSLCFEENIYVIVIHNIYINPSF